MLSQVDLFAVTVIVVNWNGRRCLPRCLNALQQQTFSDFRVLIMDNGSTDGSGELVGALKDNRFTLMSLGSNLGFARANNLGVEQAGGSKWVALLNPDAFPAPDWLERLLAAAEQCSAGAAFGSQLLSAENPDLVDGSGDNYHLSGRPFSRDHGQTYCKNPRSTGEIFSPCAAAALYLRSAWVAVGGMDEDYFCYLEDVDLGFRLRLRGYQCWFVPEAICHHMGSAITGRRSDFTIYHGQRNLVWTYVKNMPGVLFWLLLPFHLMLNLVALVIYFRRGQSRVVWRSKRDAVRGLPSTWRKRRLVQGVRSVSALAIWRVLDKSIFQLS